MTGLNQRSASRKVFNTSAFQRWTIFTICLLGIVIYSNTFCASFHFDDGQNIVTNSAIRNLYNLKSIFNYWSTRFVTFLTFAFNYRIHQLHVTGYHITNLAIHLGTSIFVWWFILLTLSTPALKNERIAGHKELLALFGGLLFVSHPVQTEAVTYIFQRTASLAALFYIVSLCFYVKARQVQKGSDGSGNRHWFYAGSLLTALFGMFTKETCFTLPFAIVFCEFFFLESPKTNRWRYLLPFFLLLPIIPVTFLLTHTPDSNMLQRVAHPVDLVSPVNYFLTQFRVIVTYLRLLLVPINQNLDYDYPISHTLWTVPTLASLSLLLLVLVCGVLFFRKYRILSFAVFFFFLSLSVESSFLPIKDVIFEHRLYLPMVGYCFFLPAGFYYLFGDKRLKPMVVILLVIIAGYSVMTYSRNRVWHDDLSLWNDVMRKSPNKMRPFYNLGVTYEELGRYQEAIDAFRQAIRLKPDDADAYNNLGVVYKKLGRYQEAIDAFRQAIRLKPDNAEEHNNLGNAYAGQGRYQEAIDVFKQAIRLKPDLAGTYYNLGNVYVRLGRYQEAINAYNQAVRLKPDLADVHYNLGMACSDLGRYQEAIDAFRQAIRLKPDDADARYNLGLVYLILGDKDSVLEQHKILKDLNGDLANKLFNQIYKK